MASDLAARSWSRHLLSYNEGCLCPCLTSKLYKVELSLVLRYEMHRIDLFPSGQDVASDGLLVKCRKALGGQRWGTSSGKNIGHAPLTGAFSEAAPLFWRHTPQGPKLLARVEKQHDQGNALRILAHQLGRAVYCMLTRQVAFEMAMLLQTSESSAGEPGASLDNKGMSRKRARSRSDGRRRCMPRWA
jgi:hypothetical protein